MLATIQSELLSSGLLSRDVKMRIYGRESWSLSLSEEHRLRVLENRVPRKLFGPRRDKVSGGWRNVHNEDNHNSYSSPGIIRMNKSRSMRWTKPAV
jgi:hypothetical protein